MNIVQSLKIFLLEFYSGNMILTLERNALPPPQPISRSQAYICRDSVCIKIVAKNTEISPSLRFHDEKEY